MSPLFGYRIEPDFDLAKDQRRDRVGWVLISGTVLCLAYLFSGRPFATEIFQGLFATILFYGDNFYVRRGKELARLWLWKSLFATIPIHVVYLCAIFWLDRVLPQLMTKAIVFLPVLALGFAIESIKMQTIIDRFKPAEVG